MKTKALVQCLTRLEIQGIEQELGKKKTKGVKAFFQALKNMNGDEEPDKTRFFQMIFGKPYSKKEDHKFRHIQRLVSEEIERFLVLEFITKDFKAGRSMHYNSTLIWLDILLDRKLYELFEKEWNKYFRKAGKEQDYQVRIRLIDKFYDYLTHHKQEDLKDYPYLAELLDISEKDWQKFSLEGFRTLNYKRGFIYYVTKHSQSPIQFDVPKEFPEFDKGLSSEPLFQYYHWLALLLHEKDHHKRIRLLTRLLDLHETVSKIRPQLSEHERDFYNWLGQCFYFLNDFETSAKYFERCVALMERHKNWSRLEVVFNYTSILSKLEQYEECIEVYQRHKEAILSNDRVQPRFGFLIAMCFVFTGFPEVARRHLSKDIHLLPQREMYYSRFVLAIIYFEEQEEELFDREITNLYQNTRYKTPEETFWVDVASVFMKFLRVIKRIPIRERKKGKHFSAIAEEIETLDQKHTMFKDSLPVRWLCRRLLIS